MTSDLHKEEENVMENTLAGTLHTFTGTSCQCEAVLVNIFNSRFTLINDVITARPRLCVILCNSKVMVIVSYQLQGASVVCILLQCVYLFYLYLK